MRHDPDIHRVTAQISITVKSKSVIETTDEGNVVLEPDVGARWRG